MMRKGFTLVELLIVIALIGILSVAVLATINPIEQANKARDAKFQNDAAEVLNAYERYYASLNTYPWGTPEDVVATTIVSTDILFGVAGVGETGVLITTSELKSSFAAKSPFNTTASTVDLMYVYNNGSDSNYVCYVPKAKANRSRYGDLRCLSATGEMLNHDDADCTAIGETDVAWNSGVFFDTDFAHFLCVPETAEVADVVPGSSI